MPTHQERYRDAGAPQCDRRLNLTSQGYCACRLVRIENDLITGSTLDFSRALNMLTTQYAPLIFGTAAVLAILLFFSIAEH